MVGITAVIITCNEERCIATCLTSLSEVVNEIIVVDSLSTDSTEAICEQFKVKFIKQRWLGYSEQKNLGHQHAHNDWILSIDADEALSPALIDAIRNADFSDETTLFSMNVLPNYCGKWVHHCGWYPGTKNRIFNRRNAQWEGDIHEKLVPRKEGKIVHLQGDLYHYTIASVADHYRKADHYSTLTAEKDFKDGKRSSWLKILLNPCWRFIRDYIFKLGILDGNTGFTICKISAYTTYQKYLKMWKMQQKELN